MDVLLVDLRVLLVGRRVWHRGIPETNIRGKKHYYYSSWVWRAALERWFVCMLVFGATNSVFFVNILVCTDHWLYYIYIYIDQGTRQGIGSRGENEATETNQPSCCQCNCNLPQGWFGAHLRSKSQLPGCFLVSSDCHTLDTGDKFRPPLLEGNLFYSCKNARVSSAVPGLNTSLNRLPINMPSYWEALMPVLRLIKSSCTIWYSNNIGDQG